MASFEIREYLKIRNTNDKAAYAVRMLQDYIRGLRSPAVLSSFNVHSLELSNDGQKLTCGERKFENFTAHEDRCWILNDDFLGPVTVLFNGIDDTINPGLFTLTDSGTGEDEVIFRIHYTYSSVNGALLGMDYWRRFLETFDCKEIRDCVEYKCVEVKEGAEESFCVAFNIPYGDCFFYIYNKDKSGFVDPEEWSGRVEPCDKWSSFGINVDDYGDEYNWLAAEKEWSQKALEEWQSVFEKLGAEMERYAEPDEENEDEYCYQGINIFWQNVSNEKVNECIDTIGSFIRYLRGFADSSEKVGGFNFRYFIGESGDDYHFYVIDDSDPAYDGVRIFRAVI